MMPGGNIPHFSHNVIAINGSAMPDDWQDKLLGADPLHRHLVLSERSVRGASFTTRDLAFPVKNSDVAFRPVYMVNAPDGSVLIADFYERYIAHGQHYQSQIDPTSGRIYRLSAKGKQRDTDTRPDKKNRQSTPADSRSPEQVAPTDRRSAPWPTRGCGGSRRAAKTDWNQV